LFSDCRAENVKWSSDFEERREEQVGHRENGRLTGLGVKGYTYK